MSTGSSATFWVFIGDPENLTILTEPLRVKPKGLKIELQFESEKELKELKLFLINDLFYGIDQIVNLSQG